MEPHNLQTGLTPHCCTRVDRLEGKLMNEAATNREDPISNGPSAHIRILSPMLALRSRTRRASEPLDERKKTRGEANLAEGAVHRPGGYGADRPAYHL